MTNTEALEAFQFASTRKLQDAYMAGTLTEQQTKSLLCTKDFTLKQVQALLRDWKATRKFLTEEGR